MRNLKVLAPRSLGFRPPNPIKRFPSALFQPAFLLLVSFYLSAVLTYNYYRRIEAPTLDKRIALHTSIVSGTAPYQFRYRILIPFIVHFLAKTITSEGFDPSGSALYPRLPFTKTAFARAYALANFIALLIFFLCLTALVRQFFGFEFSLIAALLTAVAVDFTFRDHYFHPWSLWEGAMFAAGLLLVHKRRYRSFLVLTTLGALNRETSVSLLVGFFWYGFPRSLRKPAVTFTALWRDVIIRSALLGVAAWLVVFLLVHQLVGYLPATHTAEMAWQNNRQQLHYSLLLNGLLFGPLWLLLPHGLLHSPFLIRRFSLMIPAYFAPLVYLGHWWEIRYWLSLFPILVPALVASIVRLCRRPPIVSSET